MAKSRTLLLLTVCFLQIAFIAAKPDFGVDVMIRGSGAVKGTAVLIEQQFLELTGHMNFMVRSSFDLLGQLRTQMNFLAQNVTSIGRVFASALNSATTSNSNIMDTINPIVSSLSSLQTLQDVRLPEILTEIESLVQLPIKLELQDSFRRLFYSVQIMVGAVNQLTGVLSTSNDPANIDVSFVNMVNRAANVLRANIVPLNYTIATTGENIRVVDQFLERLARSQRTSTNIVRNEFQRFMRQLAQLQNSTARTLDCTKQQLGDLATSVAPFVQSLCDDEMPCSLEGSVNQIVQLLTPDQDQVAASLLEQFNDLGDFDVNTLAGTTFNRTYDLALNLAFVTVINGPYAMYCFNKYAHLVEQLMPRVTDGLIVCFREELTRLRSLQTSLINMYVTLVYDLEDLVEYLQLCTLSPVPSVCSASLKFLYGELIPIMAEKLQQMKSYLEAESKAAYYRLVQCATFLFLKVADTDAIQLTDEIELCRQNGPPVVVSPM